MIEQWEPGDRVYWKPTGEPGTVRESGVDTVFVAMDNGCGVMAPPADFDWYTRPEVTEVTA